MKVSFTSLEEAWNLKPKMNTRSGADVQVDNVRRRGHNRSGGNEDRHIKNKRWNDYLQNIHSDEDTTIRRHQKNYKYKQSHNDLDSDNDSNQSYDDIDNLSDNSDSISESEIDMRIYGSGSGRQMPQRNYNPTIPPSIPKRSIPNRSSIEHFETNNSECSGHLQHFIDCPQCNKMIRERIEAFMNLEKKDAKMMNVMRHKITSSTGGGDPSYYPKIDQGQLYINPGTASPVKIRKNYENGEEGEENEEEEMEMKEHFGMGGNRSGGKWWNYIGEIFLLVFIGILFIYLIDMFINIGMKWKK
jgi:hypothetical protein